MQRISFFGSGVVGLASAVVFSSKGVETIITDKDLEKLDAIKSGKSPFREPKLEELLRGSLQSGKLRVNNDQKSTVLESEITLVTVGTPTNHDGSIDLSQLKSTVESVGIALSQKKEYHLMVIKSTVTPGTTSNLVKSMLEDKSKKTVGKDIGLAVNPEFLREGSAIEDTMNPHLILIGSADAISADRLEDFYKESYQRHDLPIMKVNIETAELIKCANNAFLATKISYVNTLANICSRIEGVDVEAVARAIGMDPRIGPLFLKAGPGYGGSCLPKDVKALSHFAESIGYDALFFKMVERVNELQPHVILSIAEKLIGRFTNKTIAILGLAFKKGTDDVRESISVVIVEYLIKQGSTVKVHDPMAMENVRPIFKDRIHYCEKAIDCLKDSDCCLILTDWDEYRNLRSEDFIRNMKEPNVIDAWRVLRINGSGKIRYVAFGIGSYLK